MFLIPNKENSGLPFFKGFRASDGPSFGLNFLGGQLPAGVTFTRAGEGTYFDANGVMQTAAVDQPRFDHDPVTGAPLGLLIEGSRTNLIIGSAAPATQAVTTAATSYTLSFWGTGTVTLSGTYSGSLTGTGAAVRSTLTFTATAGALTLTISGSVTRAQLEAGAFPTSYIPTGASAATRIADWAAMTGTAFSDWFNPVEGTFVVDSGPAAGTVVFGVGDTFDNTQYLQTIGFVTVRSGGNSIASLNVGSVTSGNKVAWAYKANDFAAVRSGGAVQTDNLGPVPASTLRAVFGGSPWAPAASNSLNGYIRSVRYWPTRLSNTRLQELTA